jgi:hypothetical protein
MNIFYLDESPVRAAKLQCDQHVVKMILESAQLLSTAHHELDGTSPAYKPTHKNHPSAIWARSGRRQYRWLYDHMMALGDEYTRRYGKVHLTIQKHSETLREPPKAMPLLTDWSEPPQCMPDECKRDSAVEGYFTYYKYKANQWSDAGRPMRFNGETYFVL